MNKEIYTDKQGNKIECYRVNNDIYGNPRYVIHYLVLHNDYFEALKISRKFGGKAYRGSDFGGGIVFQSYSLKHTLKNVTFLKRDRQLDKTAQRK